LEYEVQVWFFVLIAVRVLKQNVEIKGMVALKISCALCKLVVHCIRHLAWHCSHINHYEVIGIKVFVRFYGALKDSEYSFTKENKEMPHS
jgi:hypothetical protein